MHLKITKWFNRVEHSYLALLEVTASVGEEAEIFVVKDLPPAALESSSSESSSSSSSTLIHPSRVLVSVASLTDLMVYGTVIPPLGDLYRAATVAMLFRSELHMNTTLDMVQEHVAINANLQRIEFEPIEVVELSDPGHGLNLDQLYLFR